MRFSISLASSFCLLRYTFAFNVVPQPVQNLVGMADSIQTKESLDLSLNIGDEKDAFGLYGLELGLGGDAATAALPMPGFNGPHPKLSSGIKDLQVQAQAWFTGMMGRETVDIKNGCWELVWKDGAPAGALVCALEVEKEVVRNGATLPAGRFYISFPVWSAEGLDAVQARKAAVQVLANKYLAQRDEEMAKMKETNNILAKAMHYRKACLAVENYWKTGWKDLDRMTPDLKDILPVKDLILTRKGTIWKKIDPFLPNNQNQLVGSATVNVKKTE